MTYTREQGERDAERYRRAVLFTPRPVTESPEELVALALAGDRYATEQSAGWPTEAAERAAWRERWQGYDR